MGYRERVALFNADRDAYDRLVGIERSEPTVDEFMAMTRRQRTQAVTANPAAGWGLLAQEAARNESAVHGAGT